MTPPIIIKERGGDVMVFDSAEDAEAYLEATDVANGEYVGYDSEGRLLRLLPDWPHSAFLEEGESEPTHENQLSATLPSFLSQLGLPADSLAHSSLHQMIEI